MGAIQSSTAPVCSEGHTMILSDSSDGLYEKGYTCDLCRQRSFDETFDGMRHHRWHCSHCSHDYCMTCQPEHYIEESDLQEIQTKVENLQDHLQELALTICEDDRAREFLMRKFVLAPRLLHILIHATDNDQTTVKALTLECIWYFSRSAYCAMMMFKSPLLQRLIDEFEIEIDTSNLKKIIRTIYNITLVYPTQQHSSGLKALAQTHNFLKNLVIPLLTDDTELLIGCLDILDSLSNSTLYFKPTLVYPDTPVLRVLPRLLAKGDGVATRTAYFMWVLVAIDNNKKSLCRCPGILQALKRIIDENFDNGRANAFGTLWNLAALAVNKVAICDPGLGLLPILVRLINEGDEGTKISALGVTSNLSVEVQNKPLLLEPSIELLPALVRQVRESASTPRVTACQTLMNLGASEQGATEIMKTNVHRDMLEIIRNAPNDPAEWGGGSNEKVYSNNCLMNLAEWEANRAVLRRDGMVDVLSPLLAFNHFHSLTASMAYAFLVGKEEKGAYSEALQSGVIVIERLVDLLENTISKSGGDGYQYGLFRMEGTACIVRQSPNFLQLWCMPVWNSHLATRIRLS